MHARKQRSATLLTKYSVAQQSTAHGISMRGWLCMHALKMGAYHCNWDMTSFMQSDCLHTGGANRLAQGAPLGPKKVQYRFDWYLLALHSMQLCDVLYQQVWGLSNPSRLLTNWQHKQLHITTVTFVASRHARQTDKQADRQAGRQAEAHGLSMSKHCYLGETLPSRSAALHQLWRAALFRESHLKGALMSTQAE